MGVSWRVFGNIVRQVYTLKEEAKYAHHSPIFLMWTPMEKKENHPLSSKYYFDICIYFCSIYICKYTLFMCFPMNPNASGHSMLLQVRLTKCVYKWITVMLCTLNENGNAITWRCTKRSKFIRGLLLITLVFSRRPRNLHFQ